MSASGIALLIVCVALVLVATGWAITWRVFRSALDEAKAASTKLRFDLATASLEIKTLKERSARKGMSDANALSDFNRRASPK